MADLGDFGLGQELDCCGFVGGHNRLGGVPVKVREVRICGILGVGEGAVRTSVRWFTGVRCMAAAR